MKKSSFIQKSKLKMETKNIRNVGNKRNQGSNKAILNKEGTTAKLSGLSIRGRGRAPLAEISVNNRIPSTNNEGVTTKSKPGVPFQVYQDDAENATNDIGRNNSKKQCIRSYKSHSKENNLHSSQENALPVSKSSSVSNQYIRECQSSFDENKPPPAKIANTKSSPNHTKHNLANQLPMNDKWDSRILQTSATININTSVKPSFVIHQDSSPKDERYSVIKECSQNPKEALKESISIPSSINSLIGHIPPSHHATATSIETSKESKHLPSDFSINPSIDHIISQTSAAEFRNTCNDSIRSTSSPATDIYERENDLFSLLRQQKETLENDELMEDDATLQGDDEEEEIAEKQEEEIQSISRQPQPVSETVLISDEYSEDILFHVKRTELKNLPKSNYMTKQPDIEFPMRAVLVDWLIEVSEEYKLNTETIFLAVNYIDRFLSYMSVQRARLQLVGTACMFIAAKYEEIYPPDVTEFVYITDDTYTKKQVLRMEQLVLGVLEFNVTVPTAYFFANHFSKMADSTDKTSSLARYLTELTLLDADTYLPFVPSIIGASAVALARHTLGFAAWDANMVKKTGYAVEDIRMCLIALHRTFSAAQDAPQQAIVEKYKLPKHHGVSEVEPTPIF